MSAFSIPALSLVLMVGPSGSGKSTLARRLFAPGEIISSDEIRRMVRGDEGDMAGNADAFEVLHLIVAKRLAAGLLTVVDATNVQEFSRQALIRIAHAHHVMAAAIVLDLPMAICVERNDARPDRPSSAHYVRKQHLDLRRGMGGKSGHRLSREGIRFLHVLHSQAEADAMAIERQAMWCDAQRERGPFDIIGDVHGCGDELEALLGKLGYAVRDGAHRHAGGRRAIFLGDLVDRGPRNLDCLRIAMAMAAAGSALCVPGNHDAKFLRWLRGKQVTVNHGLERTIAEVEALPDAEQAAFRAQAATFIDDLVSHLVLDGGTLVVAHAGMKASMQGRGAAAVREFALYGETTGETDSYGLPVRVDWAADYRGDAHVVYGHTPVVEAQWVNKTICIDTGCVFGGALTALRWPEQELLAEPARQVWCASAKPLVPVVGDARSAQQVLDDVLDLHDVMGRQAIHTRLGHTITIREDQMAAALEACSRFGADPRWMIHVPPTMSPPETSRREGTLEHPDEVFAHYRSQGVATVVCERKHMGSRAVIVLARDAAAARSRFGVDDGSTGMVMSRTGRPFFQDTELGERYLDRLRAAITAAGIWESLSTTWLVLDTELMPWSAKAVELLRRQYAAVGLAARLSSSAAERAVAAAVARGVPCAELAARTAGLAISAEAFDRVWRGYCWSVDDLADYRTAPFHVLASESGVHVDRPHSWHLDCIDRLCAADAPWLTATEHRFVDLADDSACAAATTWWEALTAPGSAPGPMPDSASQAAGACGEGFVVKPLSFIASGPRGLVQPAIKCRGRDYLRIIYGPDYVRADHLDRLRQRGLGAKRSLALREFALGVEALERFVRREPLRRVHQCALAVLALECEPVDPRL